MGVSKFTYGGDLSDVATRVGFVSTPGRIRDRVGGR
jgi:hypothetical protein